MVSLRHLCQCYAVMHSIGIASQITQLDKEIGTRWRNTGHRNLPARVRGRQRKKENMVSLEVSWGRMGHCYAVMHSIVARQAKEAKQGVWDAFELPECAEYIEEDSTARRVLFHLWFHG